MKSSLSMIAPLRNDAGRVSILLTQLLDVLPELTPRWNLVLVDDGSTDETPELLAELASAYPQVAILHNTLPEGDVACFRRGALRTRGEVLLFRASDCDLDVTGLHKMWKRASSHPLVIARAEDDGARGRFALAAKKRQRAVASGPALQMIERRVLVPWLAAREEQDLQSYLQSRRIPRHEVEMRRCGANWWSSTAARGHASGSRAFQPQHCDRGEAAGQLKRPNYLLRLKAFALGE
ncbi:MAG: glycosyltransferase [Singulisphaera sp.]